MEINLNLFSGYIDEIYSGKVAVLGLYTEGDWIHYYYRDTSKHSTEISSYSTNIQSLSIFLEWVKIHRINKITEIVY